MLLFDLGRGSALSTFPNFWTYFEKPFSTPFNDEKAVENHTSPAAANRLALFSFFPFLSRHLN